MLEESGEERLERGGEENRLRFTNRRYCQEKKRLAKRKKETPINLNPREREDQERREGVNSGQKRDYTALRMVRAIASQDEEE